MDFGVREVIASIDVLGTPRADIKFKEAAR